MSSTEQTSRGEALLQTALDTVRSVNAERLQQLTDLQQELAQCEKRIAELENEKAMLSAKDTNLEQHNERLENQCSCVQGQVSDLGVQLAVLKGEKSALEAQLSQQQIAHKTELDRASESARRAQEEIVDLRQRLAKSEEQAARVPTLEAVQKECRDFT